MSLSVSAPPSPPSIPISAFGRLDGLKVPFRSSSQQLSLDSFSCRFVRGSSMHPAPAREGDPSLADVAVRVTTEASAVVARAARAAGDNGGSGAAVAMEAAGALLDSSAIEDQVCYYSGSTSEYHLLTFFCLYDGGATGPVREAAARAGAVA